MQNSRLDETQAGIKTAMRNFNNHRCTDDPTLWQKVKRNKEPLDESERGEWKAGLKLNIQKKKIMASGPICVANRWGTMETVTDFIFLGFKINADNDCSHEIKRPLLLGRIVMTKLDSILKNRDITLPTKVHIIKVIVFPVVMYRWESCIINKAECQRIDAFELWC